LGDVSESCVSRPFEKSEPPTETRKIAARMLIFAQVREEQVTILRQALPKCRINWWRAKQLKAMTKPPTPAEPKRKRRWYQYSLRTFFVMMTAVCIWLGWLTNQARQQRAAVAWVEEMGGSVYYDYEWVDGRFIGEAELPGPKWLREMLGIDFMADVVSVQMSYATASELAALAGLKNVQVLHLVGMPVSDMKPVFELNNLQWLDLGGTQVSEEQVTRLRRALPKYMITGPEESQ
jgi:hypothetical protein